MTAGVVTAWDPALLVQARSFAAAHGRRFAEWPPHATPEAFAASVGDAPSLTLFVGVRQMTYDLLYALIGLSVRSELPVGLMPCAPASEVPLTPGPGGGLPRRTLLYSYFFSGHGVPGLADVHGRPGSGAFFADAEHGAEAIVLHTHGNGADAPVGEAILCSRVAGRPERVTRCLPCHAGGPCIRERRDPDWYFSPASLRCRALVLLSCTGFPPADSLLQYETSLVHAALRGGTVRSVVTSIRIGGSSTFSLALTSKRYLDEGHTMGALALAINHADPGGTPHHICIGDPEHRPIRGPLEPGPVPDTPAPPVSDALRARAAVLAIAEAELLARAGSPPWPAIRDRLQAVAIMAATPAYEPVEAPPTLLGARDVPLERVTRRGDGDGRCPACGQPTARYRSRSEVSRDLTLEHCGAHGVTAVDAEVVAGFDEEAQPRAARWLFTALTLRQVAGEPRADRAAALDLAQSLEEGALAGPVGAAPHELDSRVAEVLAGAATTGTELLLTRQLRYLSASRHGATRDTHDCGQTLLHVDLAAFPLRSRRRVWFCPLCGVVGNTVPQPALPEVRVAAGRWRASPGRVPFAAGGCALALAWESLGMRCDPWSVNTWIAAPSEGELGCSDREAFAGLRPLVAVMVADGEVSTVRVPVFVSHRDGALRSLRELNGEDGAARLPWEPR